MKLHIFEYVLCFYMHKQHALLTSFRYILKFDGIKNGLELKNCFLCVFTTPAMYLLLLFFAADKNDKFGSDTVRIAKKICVNV